jgi:hypothetical protein
MNNNKWRLEVAGSNTLFRQRAYLRLRGSSMASRGAPLLTDRYASAGEPPLLSYTLQQRLRSATINA